MKVIAILENDISGGGGFNQALNAILQMKRICKGRFEYEVFTTQSKNINYLEKIGIHAVSFSFSFVDRLLTRLALNPWWHFMQHRLRLIGQFEKKLMQHRCDLVYFVTPSGPSLALQRLNYITTVWDLAHRDTPEFPEVRDFNQFQIRERNYQNSLASAFVILTDSLRLADAVSRRYGVDSERLLAMPFAPSPFLVDSLAVDKATVLKKYGLEEDYFFYPGQFWAHKNHIRILEALLILRGSGVKLKVIFSGGDKGNCSHVEDFVAKHALGEQIKLLGFVPAEEMRGLYEGCIAVVMPTYFGPTNLPPLEAWVIGKPLIYSAHLKEQVGEAAICVNPDDAGELAEAMRACTNSKYCANLIKLGGLRLRQIEQQRTAAESELLSRMLLFEVRRRCWP